MRGSSIWVEFHRGRNHRSCAKFGHGHSAHEGAGTCSESDAHRFGTIYFGQSDERDEETASTKRGGVGGVFRHRTIVPAHTYSPIVLTQHTGPLALRSELPRTSRPPQHLTTPSALTRGRARASREGRIVKLRKLEITDAHRHAIIRHFQESTQAVTPHRSVNQTYLQTRTRSSGRLVDRKPTTPRCRRHGWAPVAHGYARR